MLSGSLMKKEKEAIERLQAFSAEEPYYLCYSGGKDSDTIRILAELANVNFEVHNNHTTVDAPETVYYIREVIKQYGDKGFIHYPEKTMWQLIVEKLFPPTRLARYCCAELKEKGGKGRRKVTGVRWAESNNRKKNQGLVTIIGKPVTVQKIATLEEANFSTTKGGGIILNTDNASERRVVESCYRTTSTLINPIIDWTDEEVWEFLTYYGCKSNPGYCEGEKRIGCIGCPLAGGKQQKKEFEKYPKYRQAYVHAFDRMVDVLKAKGKQTFDIVNGKYWKDGESVMRWWVGDDPIQMTIDDYMKLLEAEQSIMEEYR